jgi:glycosyltransferase involved in cell wall biosynthesis
VIAACEGLDADLVLVEGLHHDEAFERYRDADLVVDQLDAGSYGLFASECMALGKPVLSFLHEEAVQRTQRELGVRVPIVRATRGDLRARLEPLVTSPTERERIGAESRTHVERVHDLERVADRLLALYSRL